MQRAVRTKLSSSQRVQSDSFQVELVQHSNYQHFCPFCITSAYNCMVQIFICTTLGNKAELELHIKDTAGGVKRHLQSSLYRPKCLSLHRLQSKSLYVVDNHKIFAVLKKKRCIFKVEKFTLKLQTWKFSGIPNSAKCGYFIQIQSF